jgi:hypothetical protein
MANGEIILYATERAAKKNRWKNMLFSRDVHRIFFFAFSFLIFAIKIFANERESSVAQLRQVLFERFPINADREEIDLCFQHFISSKFSDSKTSFHSAGERAYWETLKYPYLWQELYVSLDRELLQFVATGNVSDELRFIIAQLYLFGHLEYRPIFFCDGKGIDTEDRKLPFSAAIGPAIEVARFVRQTGARKVFEVFSGRGNMTLLLSLAGLDELITVELDTYLDIEASWKSAIDKLFEEIPSVFWPKVTKPLFLSGDILEIGLPSVDCVVMDPPYGYASSCYASTATAFLFFLDVLACLQEGSFQSIYSLIPTEWVSIIHLFTERSEPINIQQSIDQILQKSVYYQRKPDKWTSLIQAFKEDVYVENLKGKIGRIQGISSARRTPIQNVLGKELDIFQIHLLTDLNGEQQPTFGTKK